jgi:hypothetical protein
MRRSLAALASEPGGLWGRVGVIVIVFASVFAIGATPAGSSVSKWTISPTPVPDPTSRDARLDGVSCTDANFCEAVGQDSLSDGSITTVVESWDGTAWSVVPSPNPTADSELNAVSCTSSTSCVAVGTTRDTFGYYATLIESWDGVAWTVTPSPPSNKYRSILWDVSCPTATSCVAVGEDRNPSVALVEIWDGTSWQVETHTGQDLAALYAVSCTSSTWCTAVGTVIEQLNGTQFSQLRLSAGDRLWGISCSSPSFCVATGTYLDTSSVAHPITYTWNGTSWTRAVAPTPARAAGSELYEVSCLNTTHCTAVGYASYKGVTGLYHFRTVIQSWNGTAWKLVASPNPTSGGADLNDVSCQARQTCTAVGDAFASTGEQTFAVLKR